jgi:hypothetical protein
MVLSSYTWEIPFTALGAKPGPFVFLGRFLACRLQEFSQGGFWNHDGSPKLQVRYPPGLDGFAEGFLAGAHDFRCLSNSPGCSISLIAFNPHGCCPPALFQMMIRRYHSVQSMSTNWMCTIQITNCLPRIGRHGTVSDMVEYRKPRDAASLALIELRNKMGLTQAGLAVAFLKTAVTTVAKYETSHRPPTEMLLRLSEIAKAHDPALASKFRIFYLEDVLKAVGNQVTWVPKTESEPLRGFVTASLSGEIAIRGAMDFLTLAQRAGCNPELQEDDVAKKVAQKMKEDAISALAALQAAAQKGEDPRASKIRAFFAGTHAKHAPLGETPSKPRGKASKSRPKSSR